MLEAEINVQYTKSEWKKEILKQKVKSSFHRFESKMTPFFTC